MPHIVGTAARITTVERLPDGRLNIQAVGQDRFRVVELREEDGCLIGAVQAFPLLGSAGGQAHRQAHALAPWLRRYIDLLAQAAATAIKPQELPAEPEALGFLAAMVAQIPMLEKQRLLSAAAAPDLLRQERAIYRREVSLLRAMLTSNYARDTVTFSPN